MTKHKNNNKKLKVATATAILLSGVVPSMVVGIDTAKAAEPNQVADFTYTETGTGVTITAYKGTATDVVVPDKINGKPVTEIGAYAFYPTSKSSSSGKASVIINSLDLPSTVEKIGNFAFGYTNINTLDISNVKEFGTYLFAYTTNLETVVLDTDLEEIPQFLFANSSIKEFTVPSKVKTISISAFQNAKLERITLPEGLEEIQDYAFSNTKLTSIDLPETVTKIGKYAFQSVKLDTIKLPESMTEIGEYAFASSLLTSINLTGNITKIGDYAFYYSKLATLEIPSNIKTIGKYAFANNTSMKSLTFQEGVSEIQEYAFKDAKLEKLVLPNSLKTLGANAFYNNLISDLTIGGGVETLENSVFSFNKLVHLSIPENVKDIKYNAFTYNQLQSIRLPKTFTMDNSALGSTAKTGKNFIVYGDVNASGAEKYADDKGYTFALVDADGTPTGTKLLKVRNGRDLKADISADLNGYTGDVTLEYNSADLIVTKEGNNLNIKPKKVGVTDITVTYNNGTEEVNLGYTVNVLGDPIAGDIEYEIADGIKWGYEHLGDNQIKLISITKPTKVGAYSITVPRTIGGYALVEAPYSIFEQYSNQKYYDTYGTYPTDYLNEVKIADNTVKLTGTQSYYRNHTPIKYATTLDNGLDATWFYSYDTGVYANIGGMALGIDYTSNPQVVDTLEIPDTLFGSTVKAVAYVKGFTIGELRLPNTLTDLGVGAFSVGTTVQKLDMTNLTQLSKIRSSSVTFAEGSELRLGQKAFSARHVDSGTGGAQPTIFAGQIDKLIIASDVTYMSNLWASKASSSGYTVPLITMTIKNIVVEEGVKEVGGFSYITGLETLELADSVTNIASYAFSEMYSIKMKELILPKTVLSVGQDAFLGSPMEKITVLNQYLRYAELPKRIYISANSWYNNPTETDTNKPFVLTQSGLIHSYKGSTTELLYLTSGFVPFEEGLVEPTIKSNLVNGNSYNGSITPVFTIKDAEEVKYKLNGQPYDGVSTINNVGDNKLEVEATNGSLKKQLNYNFKITENKAPEAVGTIANTVTQVGKLVTINLKDKFTDFEGDNLKFEVDTNDYNASQVWVNSSNELKFVGHYADKYTVTVFATDGSNPSDKITFEIDVKEATGTVDKPVGNGGQAPVLLHGLPNQTVRQDEMFKVNIKDLFSDVDTENLQYIAETSDDVFSTVTVDKNGNLKFIGDYADVYSVTVKAFDGESYSDSFTFDIDVLQKDAEKPLVIINENIVEVNELNANNNEVINVSLNEEDGAKSINLSGLLRNIDMTKTELDVLNTNDTAVEYTYDRVKQVITFNPTEKGFSNIQLVADDGVNDVVLLFMIDVSDKANTSINYIANAQILLGSEAYIVALDEVYPTTETVTYTVEVKAFAEDSVEGEVPSESTEEKDVLVDDVTGEENPEDVDVDDTTSDTNLDGGVTEEEIPEGSDVDDTTSDTNLDGGVTNPIASVMFSRFNLVASLDMPMMLLANLQTTALNESETVYEVPAGVDNVVIYEDENLLVRLVNGKLVSEGKTAGNYEVVVKATTASGELAPVRFNLEVLPSNASGGGTSTETEGEGNGEPEGTDEGTPTGNGGSAGGTTGGTEGGSTGGTEGGSAGGTTGGTEGGSAGGTEGGSAGGTTGGTEGGTEGGSTDVSTGGKDKVDNTSKVDLTDLDDKLKEKVDSLIAEVIAKDNELSLSLDGDKDDLGNIKDVIVNKDGVFIVVGGKELKIGDIPNGTKIAFDDARAVRLVNNKISTVMHYLGDKGLNITSSNLKNIVITERVEEPFKDVEAKDWFKNDVEDIFNYVITQGTTAVTYDPNSSITRGQFAAMIARALEVTDKQVYAKYTLKDLNSKQWYADEVQMLVDLGIISGYDNGTFGGNDTLTRQQASAMIERTLKHLGVDTEPIKTVSFKDHKAISAYALNAVNFLAENGVLVSGSDTAFNPHDNLTRAQMAKVLMQGLKLSNKY